MSDNGDGVIITFELRFKPEHLQAFLDRRDQLLGGAAAMPGYRHIRVVQNKDDPCRILFIEHWDDEKSYRAYIDWRTSRGEMDGLKHITNSTETLVWPTPIVQK